MVKICVKKGLDVGRLFEVSKLLNNTSCVWCLAVQMLRPKLCTIGEGEPL